MRTRIWRRGRLGEGENSNNLRGANEPTRVVVGLMAAAAQFSRAFDLLIAALFVIELCASKSGGVAATYRGGESDLEKRRERLHVDSRTLSGHL